MDIYVKYRTVFAEVDSPIWDQQDIDTLQFDPIAKAAFDFATVTSEVRPHYYWCIRKEI